MTSYPLEEFDQHVHDVLASVIKEYEAKMNEIAEKYPTTLEVFSRPNYSNIDACVLRGTDGLYVALKMPWRIPQIQPLGDLETYSFGSLMGIIAACMCWLSTARYGRVE